MQSRTVVANGTTAQLRSPPGALERDYPRLHAYLAQLPDGLASYSACQARGTLASDYLAAAPTFLPFAWQRSPDVVLSLLAQPTTLWIPEVRLAATLLALADHHRHGDDEHLIFVADATRFLLKGMAYRALMAFLSPEALVAKAASRWSALHRGTELEMETSGDGVALATLTFPPRLLNASVARFYGASLKAALEHARASDVALEIDDVGETWVTFRATWTT